MDEYTLTLLIFGALVLVNALGYWVGVTVERDKWRRRAQIRWELARQQADRVKLLFGIPYRVGGASFMATTGTI